MPSSQSIHEHARVQKIAKQVLHQLGQSIGPEDNEQSIALRAQDLLAEHGCNETWYYACPALVLLGSRSCISISGREYQAGEEMVGYTNLVSVDLSPLHNQHWGDCARSFAIEDGKLSAAPQNIEFRNGLTFLNKLHDEMRTWVKPQTTFAQLFDWTNLRIRQSGFVNLDYRNNVGHSIVKQRDERNYIEANNFAELASVDFFSFEPFIRLKGGKWGFKHEEIFYFDESGQLQIL